jgi:hypothetical protein
VTRKNQRGRPNHPRIRCLRCGTRQAADGGTLCERCARRTPPAAKGATAFGLTTRQAQALAAALACRRS